MRHSKRHANYTNDGIAAAATLEASEGCALFKAFLQFKSEPTQQQFDDFLRKFEVFVDSCFEPQPFNEAPRLVAVK